LNASKRRELEIYIQRGSLLVDPVSHISRNILEVIKSSHNSTMSEPKLFFFVEASSGMGKCQLAEALTIPVVYIPLVGGQLIYQCFEEVSRCISHALLLDQIMTNHGFKSTLHSGDLRNISFEFHAVGLLVALFKAVCGRSNEESIKLLSGYNSSTSIYHSSMQLRSAVSETKKMLFESITNDLIRIYDRRSAIHGK
jgi:hypothetical protein